MSLFNLLEGESIVITKTSSTATWCERLETHSRRHWNIATVKHSCPAVERVDGERNIVTPTKLRQYRFLPVWGAHTRG